MKMIARKMLAEGIDALGGLWGYRISTFVSVLARGKPSNPSVLADEAILRHFLTYNKA
ncbi:hypothetical protein Q4601_14340 [Shewanella sp. 1_MG-2023]|uniref:hypothetical protein n=1 Tax=unclassified Shewanella TaxID=196818 RepID=UPI0026E3534E|nr:MULTISPECIES: hypothetical protein [unclassified Shewanella]MDO6611388.1 hypothetical protein [Shewanella sp. 7_MG-2023]MDO6771243.1 hypothetical protein [Shewanella sp. 2_MG-2023]MDO6795484.1 hypothetical protein [Shewanella sp. 1_MG-2023]